MAIHVALTHRTTYDFDRPTVVHPHVVRLRPAPHTRTPILQYSLTVEPGDHFVNWQQDPFGNHLARLVFPEPTTRLEFTVDLVADMTVINPFDFFVEEAAEHHPFTYDARVAADLAPYLHVDPAGPLLSELLAELRAELGSHRFRTIDMLVHVNQRLQGAIAYTTRLEPGVQTSEQTLERALGSCRDTGWLLALVLRHLGYATRFVSGYLVQLASDDQDPLDGPAGPAEDFTDLHAWCEVYVPGAGWIGMDPTSGLFAGEGHIPLAATPEPASAAPIEGTTSITGVTLDFANLVTRIHEDPRVTAPYAPAERARIEEVGRAVDARLVANDVRLTMGGEPTFISVDEPEEPEWTVDADGEHKRVLAWDLAQRLADRFAPGGLVQHGQGKWYPGEPLPRWQLGIVWRTDGEAVWSDRARLADPFASDDGGATAADARALLTDIGVRLGMEDALAADRTIPGHEDRLWQLWQEATQPEGPPPDVDPDPSTMLTPTQRAALRVDLDALPGDPTGWILPLFRAPTLDAWATTTWRLRRGHVALVAGDSPMGLRLPIGSLGWTPPDAEPERSPFEERDELPTFEEVVAQAPEGEVLDVPAATSDTPVTAMCVEPRNGLLHVFLPPLEHAEAFLALVGVVEAAAAAMDVAVVVEGYAPPGDPRLRTIVVAPDPGVIEVNVHPTGSFDELVAVTEGLYEDARRSRLTTERFDIDGSHTGTGGGNHVTIGGATPADSPLLRRPDLLVSLLTYWQHHPALSYLFSSRFVGPTSQAPRIDEAPPRNSPASRGRTTAPRHRHGGSTAPCATCSRTSPATPTAPSSASTSCTHPTPNAAGSACSSCAPSRCRHIPRWRWSRPCWSVASCCAAGRTRTGPTPSGGARCCTTGSCCRTSSSRTSPRSPPTCAPTASTCPTSGWRRSPNSASRAWARRRWPACTSNCVVRSSRGRCWGRRPRPAAPPGTWTVPSSASRSRPVASCRDATC